MGGLPRRATFISRQKEDLLPMVLVDAGNAFAGHPLPESALGTVSLRAELILKAMERMGYAAAALGEMDLYLGLDRLKALNALTAVRLLSANLVDGEGDSVFEPYITVQAGDLKVLVLGLTQVPTKPDLAAERLGACTVSDPLAAASRWIPEVRPACDLLIVLSSLGRSVDLQLARSVEGIDVIIGGRDHRFSGKTVIENRTLITSGYYQGRAMGLLTISYNGPVQGWVSGDNPGFPDHRIDIAGEQGAALEIQNGLEDLKACREAAEQRTVYTSDMITLDPSFDDDPGIVSMVLEYRKSLNLPSRSRKPE